MSERVHYLLCVITFIAGMAVVLTLFTAIAAVGVLSNCLHNNECEVTQINQ